jgi:hydroxyacylglutathione hydrolase
MFHSIQRFKQLPDYMMVWPAHGAGSACGKSLGAVPMSTVGYERQFNWAMREENEGKFVEELLKDQPEAPVYFAEMKRVNKVGPNILKERTIPTLTDAQSFKSALADKNTFVLDTREAVIAGKNLAVGSVNIPFNKSFTNWVGWLIGYDLKIVIIAKEENRNEILKSLASIHFDNVIAFVVPDLVSQVENTSYGTLPLEQFLNDKSTGYHMDVRNDSEWNNGYIEGAKHHFLGTLRNVNLPKETKIFINCQSGARSAIAASLLKSLGYTDVNHLEGGYLGYVRSRVGV